MTDDLVKRLRDLVSDDDTENLTWEAADRIEALEEALKLADAALSGANMNMNVVQKKVRAALGEKKDG
jgi:hypothetical protein